MSDESPETVECNLFAREIKALLKEKGFTMWSLATKAGIHSEVVRRLIYSLTHTKAFPTLNPGYLRTVQAVYDLSGDEMSRLMAAIMATSIETTLMNRVRKDIAFQAAEAVFTILHEALLRDGQLHNVLPDLEKMEIGMSAESEDIDTQFAAFFLQLDQGQLALHIGFVAIERDEQIESLQRSIQYFTEALSEIEQVSEPLRGSQNWLVWHEEAEFGIHTATIQLAQIQK